MCKQTINYNNKQASQLVNNVLRETFAIDCVVVQLSIYSSSAQGAREGGEIGRESVSEDGLK